MAGRPYFKYFIGGGLVLAQGGPCLAYGLEFAFFMDIMPGSTMMTTLAIVLSIIGVASLCIGIPLLYKGVLERDRWLRLPKAESPEYHGAQPLIRPLRQAPLRENFERRFCASCGILLPNLLNIKFCPKCGDALC